MDMANLSSLIKEFTRDIGNRIRSMDKVSLIGLMDAITKESGHAQSYTAVVLTPGQMGVSMKVNMSMIKKVATVSTHGLMVKNIKDNG